MSHFVLRTKEVKGKLTKKLTVGTKIKRKKPTVSFALPFTDNSDEWWGLKHPAVFLSGNNLQELTAERETGSQLAYFMK